MYTQKVMEAFQNPKNVGEIQDYDGMGMIGSEACGDIMQVFIKVRTTSLPTRSSKLSAVRRRSPPLPRRPR